MHCWVTGSKCCVDDEKDSVESVGATGVVLVMGWVVDEGDAIVVLVFGRAERAAVVTEYL